MCGMSARYFSLHPASRTHSPNATFLTLVDYSGEYQNNPNTVPLSYPGSVRMVATCSAKSRGIIAFPNCRG